MHLVRNVIEEEKLLGKRFKVKSKNKEYECFRRFEIVFHYKERRVTIEAEGHYPEQNIKEEYVIIDSIDTLNPLSTTRAYYVANNILALYKLIIEEGKETIVLLRKATDKECESILGGEINRAPKKSMVFYVQEREITLNSEI
ncbi:MAG: hypothetical protein KatS3mg083_265 [Candidatus Dojkabacteria bacterium]|nr:MAG: hypothetical protein KatS3mg083_265 [Candidatus Dojkabacteria bacterium]